MRSVYVGDSVLFVNPNGIQVPAHVISTDGSNHCKLRAHGRIGNIGDATWSATHEPGTWDYSMSDKILERGSSKWISTTPYNLDAEFALFVDCTSGDKTVNLPQAVTCLGRIYSVHYGAGGNNVHVLPHAGDTIHGTLDYVMPDDGRSVLLISDGINTWHPLANNF